MAVLLEPRPQTQSQRTNVPSLSAKKRTLLNGTKMFPRIYFYHITDEDMFKTSKIVVLGWNKLTIAQNVLTLGKVARSCSFAKKLLKIQKVAQNSPRGPKPEEAYTVATARNITYKYILVIPRKKSRFVQFKPAMCFRVIAAIGIGNGLRFQWNCRMPQIINCHSIHINQNAVHSKIIKHKSKQSWTNKDCNTQF